MPFATRFKPRKASSLRCGRTPALNPVQVQFKGMCDINNIVKRAFAGDPTVFRAARYGDSVDAPDDLHAALQQQVDARNAYNALPASVRKEYPTPEAYFAALHDDSQVDKLRSLGVLNPVEDETPIKVEVTNPVTAQAAE